MWIEAFSEAKDPSRPETNEDALVILPGRAFGVIDGVSDRSGVRYDGMLSGCYAARLLQRALERLLGSDAAPLDDPAAIARAMTAEIAAAYDRLGIADAVARDRNRQIQATLTLLTLAGDAAHLLIVGDSGARLNGDTLIREEKDLDAITASLRRIAWPVIAARVADPAERERLSRLVTWQGTRNARPLVAPTLDQNDLDAVEAETKRVCRDTLPHVPEADIATLVEGGIVHGQGRYQNNTASVLGYSCLNGFPVPPSLIRVERFDRMALRSVELFTDGYFAPGEAFGVDGWERRFAEVEREDPSKVLRYPSPKGSVGGTWADDRTYLGTRFHP